MRYDCISADCPWPETGGGNRGANAHYNVERVEDMPKLLMSSPAFPPETNAHFWMWATVMNLPGALWVLQRVAFRYVTHWVWEKGEACPKCKGLGIVLQAVRLPHTEFEDALCPTCKGTRLAPGEELQKGLGQYQRGSHELLLLGSRGKPRVPATALRWPSVFAARRTEHSRKPDIAYELMSNLSGNKRIELFARGPREGWDVWGHEAEAT